MNVEILVGLLLPLLLVLLGASLFLHPRHLVRRSARADYQGQRQPAGLGWLLISAGIVIGLSTLGRIMLAHPFLAHLLLAAHLLWFGAALVLVRRMRLRNLSEHPQD